MEKIKLGNFWYCFSDAVSRIRISHKECTECLDAWVESGELFLPYWLKDALLLIEEVKGTAFLPNGRDLYLVNAGGNERIDEILFGNQDNFLEKWNNHYEVTGQVTGIKNHGFTFRVDEYKQVQPTEE